MYCTNDDIISAFPNDILTELMENDVIDSDTLNNAIDAADGVIEGFIRERYTLPLSEPYDRIIKKISMDLSIVILFGNSRISGFLPDAIRGMEDRAMNFLYKISTGEIVLNNRNQRIFTNIEEIEYSHIL